MSVDQPVPERGWKRLWRRWKRQLDAFFLGAAMSWVMVPKHIHQRQEMERMFALIATTRLVGVPLLPPAYSLRLLPYFLPNLLYWRRMTAFDRAMEGADLKHIGH